MRRLTHDEFLKEERAFEEAVLSTDYLAKFCSHIPWQNAARLHLHGFLFGIQKSREHLIIEEGGNWLVFTEREERTYFPFESAWMFGCPLVGEPAAVIDLLQRAAKEYVKHRCGFVISGMLEDSDMYRQMLQFAERCLKFQTFPTTDCMTIDLSDGGGVESFIARKSRSFRKSIRQMKELPGLEFEDASSQPPEDALKRIFDVQSRSHKAAGGDIFSHQRYELFYRDIYQWLFERNRIRTRFARIGDKDIAYIMGGVMGPIYRGFQMSFDDEFRSYAMGNRLQLDNIQKMAEDGITHYDLGMHSDYKERWADHRECYRGVFVVL